jgi:hypothetical protein
MQRACTIPIVARLLIMIGFGCMALSFNAIAADFGVVSLDHGAAKSVSIGGSGRNLRVCNDAGSASSVLVTIGGNAPRYLTSGLCAEDIGDRVTMQNLGSGTATIDYKATCDSASMD